VDERRMRGEEKIRSKDEKKGKEDKRRIIYVKKRIE
jgi:hypothetical protein